MPTPLIFQQLSGMVCSILCVNKHFAFIFIHVLPKVNDRSLLTRP